MTDCELCGLPTPTPPIERQNRQFCCGGCAEVYQTLDEVEPMETADSGTPDEPGEREASPEGEEAYLAVDGMHCSSCEVLVERAGAATDGVLDVQSSYATETAKVVYDPDQLEEAELPSAVSVAGYDASLRGTGGTTVEMTDRDLFRLLVGGVAGMMVMMVYIAYYYPLYLGIVDSEASGGMAPFASVYFPGVVTVWATVAVFYVGFPILQGAYVGVRTRILNMDVLISVAVLAAYAFSLVELVGGGVELYFDVATVITVVVTGGRYYETRVKRRSTDELADTIASSVDTARVRREGTLEEAPVEDVDAGATVVVREGEHVPLDGTVIEGRAAVNEALVTGEPVPAVKQPGDAVIGGSVLEENALVIEVGEAEKSTLDRLSRILWDVQSSTPGVQKVADKLATVFVPAVLLLAAGAATWWVLSGAGPERALTVGLATLIVSCPCALGLATPLAVAAGTNAGLKRNLVVTSADAFERAPDVDIVAIDKTGTLSRSELAVADVVGGEEVVARAAALEQYSTHPIAAAIAELPTDLAAKSVETHPGKGVRGTVADREVAVGSRDLFEKLEWSVPADLERKAGDLPSDRVVSFVGWAGSAKGLIATTDVEREAWEDVVSTLGDRARVVLLTGDDDPRGFDAAVDEAYVGLPPEAKAETVRRLGAAGEVAMVGDGSNDAPALAAADLGIAFGHPTALAADAADVVVAEENLRRVVDVFDVLAGTRTRIRQNLGWAFVYNATAIPLAVASLINPLLAAVAMSASSLLVVGNSARQLGEDA